MDVNTDENFSDEEIFFGKITLKEVKKCIFMNQPHRQTITCLSANKKSEDQEDESIRIIETCSEPELVSVDDTVDSNLKSISSPSFISYDRRSINSDVKSDDSFTRLEKMVSELCMSPTENKHPQLDSTLDVVDFILNNAELKKENINECDIPCLDNLNLDTQNKEETNINPDIKEFCNSPIVITENVINTSKAPTNNTHNCETGDLNVTQRNEINVLQINQNANIFKTPKNPVSNKKQIVSAKKTPNRSNAYQHITSPIASYIKNSPQVPLLKDVHPRKPLPGTSSIPQPIKTLSKPVNKENIQIPSMAYKSAKKTKMVSAPNQERMPQGKWTNKLTSTLKKPVVITHDHRVVNSAVKNLNKGKEDSFANLPLQQADLSVCTKKSAFC